MGMHLYSKHFIGVLRQKLFTSTQIYLLYGVLMTLFHFILEATRSAMRVVVSCRYSMRFSPIVILTLFGSSFCGLQSPMICAHDIYLSVGMFLIASKKKVMIVPFISVALWPWIMLPNSMAIVLVHISFANVSVANFSKLVMVLLILGYLTFFAKYSHGPMCSLSWNFHWKVTPLQMKIFFVSMIHMQYHQ